MSGFFAFLFLVAVITSFYYVIRALISYVRGRRGGWFTNKYIKRFLISLVVIFVSLVLHKVTMTPEEEAEFESYKQAKIEESTTNKDTKKNEQVKLESENKQKQEEDVRKIEENTPVTQAKPAETKQAPNYKYIFKQDLPRITGANCMIYMDTLEMNRMGNDFVIFHCTASLDGKPSQIEALYYASDGKLVQMKANGEVIFHDIER